jgi:RNA polymerase sigma-70 factor, ECF subfamily
MSEAMLDRQSLRWGTVAVRSALAPSELDCYRRELTAYCYRMLGSGFEAEDAVQETMVRAWQHSDRFEGRSSVRTWLYRIATNVCIDMQRQVQRRARPMDMGPASLPDERLIGPVHPETTWIAPFPDALGRPDTSDPAAIAEYRESIRLAFVSALQHLPARQRAALILCEVLHWRASEVAELLDTTVAAINSALQRARATMSDLDTGRAASPLDEDTAALLERYVEAFERYDVERIVTLLHDDAIQSMPPFAMWVQGADAIGRFMREPEPSHCAGSRMLRTEANGGTAFAQYRPDPAGGHAPWAIQVLEVADGKITHINSFLALAAPDRLFADFGLPAHLDA